MAKHRYWLLLFVVLAFRTSLFAEYFRQIGLSEGLTQPSVMAIYQDQLGRMWFGTREGINRYDGERVTAFKGWVDSPGKASSVWLGNEVSSIAGDRQGNLFFLIDDDIIKFDMQAEAFSRLTEGGGIRALASFEGNIWYMRHDSLFCLPSGGDASAFMLKTGIESPIVCLTLLPDKICIGTHDGAFFIDPDSHRQCHVLKGHNVYRIFKSSQKELWLGTRMQGLYRMKEGEEPVQVPYKPGSADGISSWQIRDFVEDREHNIWFGTFDGLQKYNAGTGEYSLVRIPKYVGGLNHPSVFSLYKDVQGTIWVGSYYGGVNYFTPRLESFVHYDYDRNATNNLYYSYIGDMLVDKNGQVWLSTDGGGISCTDKNWNIIHRFAAGAEGTNSLPHNNIKSIAYDEANECLYIGTYLGGLSRYDMRAGKFYNYLKERKGDANVPDEVVFHVQMWNGSLYLSARNGVFCLDTKTQQFHKLDVEPAYYECFDIDPEGYIYLCRWNSLILARLDRTGKAEQLVLSQESHNTYITRVRATHQGAYISTLGAGLFFYDKKTGEIGHYTTENHRLPSDFCYNIVVSRSGNVLITTDKGISCYFPGEKRFTTIDLKENFPSTYIINGCGLFVSENNQIFVGDTKGVTTFSEDEFRKANTVRHMPELYFSKLWVNNQAIVPGDGSGILARALPYTRKIRLEHDENNLVFSFALSDYGQQLLKKQFRYKLDGFDKKWIKTDKSEIHYTNLEPGTYTLRIATVTDNGQGEEITGKESCMELTIICPWYATWWAWLFYVTAFMGCIYYFISSRIAKRTLAFSLEKERFEKQQIEQLNQEKLVFFTNVSHEFRTPLTLIISHIDILLQKYSLTPSIYNQILKIRKNAQKMNNLVSELLEFRKLEQNHEVLQLNQQDIVAFLKEIYLSFADYARQREINYAFHLPESAVSCWFDPQLMEKVFFNLLSNAFKYTSDKGAISLSGEITDNEITVHITDAGIGIPEQDTDRIFTRFFQSGNSGKKSSFFSGTGIGLALTKTIVEKHHGEITVKSIVGEGSTFTVRLPRRKEAFLDDKNVRLADRKSEAAILPGSLPVLPDDNDQPAESEMAENITDKSRTLLLVEDNEELLQVLAELFAPFYQIVCANNGKEGLKQAYEHKPDLIISDIMMPEMTGTEMCLQIKNNIDFCHIPVILLTALNSPEQNIEGLNRGADDYITKPFHAQLLLARVNNLIRGRLLMQHQFDKKPLSEIDLTSINPLDKDLLKRAVESIEQHMDDTDFDIPVLCKEVGMGRSLLYTKFKALTGMTPNNFILNHRLKYAATLLQQYSDLPVAEVSDRCGFSTPVYFSRCFKAQYGCTPQNYKKDNKGKRNPGIEG